MRLLLDEMYSHLLAAQLRARGHDVVSVHELDELHSAEDPVIFEAMQRERRTILTNDVGHFVPLASRAMEGGAEHAGVVLTSDRSLSRARNNLGTFVDALDDFMSAHPEDDAISNRVVWLKQPT